MDARRFRIIVVDDNADIRSTMGELLQLDGYDVRVAADAFEALDLVALHGADCVLTDLGLPAMDGCALARRLRIMYGRKLLLIAVTGWSRAEERRLAEAAGMDAVLAKPMDPSELRRWLPPAR